MKKILLIIICCILQKGFSQENPINIDWELNESYFVKAKSGLNYRKSPKGNILGKFDLNTRLEIVEFTGFFDQIKDENKILKGQWVGVKKGKEIVYVFNAFLSDNYISSDLKIYTASSFYREENGDTRTAFINLSDSYFGHDYDPILKGKQKDTLVLNKKQRSRFLKELKISESDKVFLYDFNSDYVHSYEVKNLPVIACVNIYAEGGEDLSEDDLEYGFDLKKKYKGPYSHNFVFIGKKNPFQTGKAKPIIWEEINTNDFPKKFDLSIVSKDIQTWFDGHEIGKSYKFSNKNYEYYIQNISKEEIFSRYLVIKKDGDIIYETVFTSSESRGLMPLGIKGQEESEYFHPQWTGEVFKNKPPIIYDFMSISFGCESIEFTSKKEPYIWVLCDNRH